MGAGVNDYNRKITYELALLRAGEEELPQLDGKRVASTIERLRDEAARGDAKAEAALVRVGLLFGCARERRRRVDELRRRLRVWDEDAGAIGGTIE
jgi:hypothetical protein